MPTVPVYSTPDAAPQGLPAATQQVPYHLNTNIALAGREASEMGHGLLAAGTEIAGEATRQQIEQNEAAAKDADAQGAGMINAILYDPDSGYKTMKGKQAVDSYQATVDSLQKIPDQLGQTLQNPAQAQLVKPLMQMRIQAAIAEAGRHSSEQSSVYQKTSSDIRVKTAQDTAPMAYNPVSDTALASFNQDEPASNSSYQLALQTIQSETRDQAARQGLPQDAADDLVKAAMGRAYVSTVAHLIDRKGGSPADLAVAKQYFDAVRDQMPADAQDKVRAVLEAGLTKDQALSLAIDVKGQTGDIAAQEKILDDQFKAGQITGGVHDMALQHLRADNAQRRSEQVEGDKALLGQVWQLARNGGTATDLAPSQLARIAQRGLGSSVDAILNRERNGNLDDSQQYSDLMRMSAEDPASFTRMDLAKMSGNLTGSHWNHLVGIQQGINRQDTRAMVVAKVTADAVKDTRAQMAASGVNLTPNDDAGKQQLAQFETSLHDALAAAQPQWDAKKLTPGQMRDEARAITLGMLKDHTLSGTGFFGSSIGQSHMPVWKMSAEQRAAPWDIPSVDRSQISQSLQRRGIPLTEDNIQRAYKAAQGTR